MNFWLSDTTSSRTPEGSEEDEPYGILMAVSMTQWTTIKSLVISLATRAPTVDRCKASAVHASIEGKIIKRNRQLLFLWILFCLIEQVTELC